jgi:hypothetical protein
MFCKTFVDDNLFYSPVWLRQIPAFLKNLKELGPNFIFLYRSLRILHVPNLLALDDTKPARR